METYRGNGIFDGDIAVCRCRCRRGTWFRGRSNAGIDHLPADEIGRSDPGDGVCTRISFRTYRIFLVLYFVHTRAAGRDDGGCWGQGRFKAVTSARQTVVLDGVWGDLHHDLNSRHHRGDDLIRR